MDSTWPSVASAFIRISMTFSLLQNSGNRFRLGFNLFFGLASGQNKLLNDRYVGRRIRRECHVLIVNYLTVIQLNQPICYVVILIVVADDDNCLASGF